jgi:Zn-dependent peptidase ImmA (M78 family)
MSVVDLEEILDGPEVPLGRAEREAMKVLRRTVANERGKITLPINPRDVAAALGIETKTLKLAKNISGAISKAEGQRTAVAVANLREPHVRQRFTFAHEIGHFVKRVRQGGPDTPGGFVERRDELSTKGTDSEEKFANAFAAALLMPGKPLTKYWGQGMSVKDLARKFNVSEQAMENRIKSLMLY